MLCFPWLLLTVAHQHDAKSYPHNMLADVDKMSHNMHLSAVHEDLSALHPYLIWFNWFKTKFMGDS